MGVSPMFRELKNTGGTPVPLNHSERTQSGGGRLVEPLAEQAEVFVRARDHLDGDDFADLRGGFGAGVDSGHHGGDIAAEAVRFGGDSLHVTAPFAPGLRQLVLRYELPKDAFPLSLPVAEEVGVLEVLLEDSTARAEAPGLTREEPVSLEGRRYERFLAQGVAPGAISSWT